MHVGYGVSFQNPDNALSDAEVYQNEVRMAEMAEPLGFDSIWSVEHHFDDYTMCPDVLQFLTYMAGRTKNAKLGSMVVVLPWHDPIRVAEQVSVLDHLSNGRLILGLGRGLARIEFLRAHPAQMAHAETHIRTSASPPTLAPGQRASICATAPEPPSKGARQLVPTQHWVL